MHSLAQPSLSEGSPIAILGMMRSGSSMLASLLSEAGVYLGEEHELLPPVADDNPDGYWEHKAFYELNDRLLARLGGTVLLLPEIPKGWSQDSSFDDLKLEARKLLANFTGHPNWGWKDPRTMALMEFWAPLVPGIRAVLVVRNPIEVAASLSRRDFEHAYFAMHRSLDLWYRYHRQLDIDFGYSQCVVTTLDRIQDAPAQEMERILSLLGILHTAETIEESTAKIIKRSYRHSRLGPRLTSRFPLNSDTRAEYQELLKLAGSANTEDESVENSFENAAILIERLFRDFGREAYVHGLTAKAYEDCSIHAREMERRIASMTAAQESTAAEFDKMRSTISWRITKPLRAFRKLF